MSSRRSLALALAMLAAAAPALAATAAAEPQPAETWIAAKTAYEAGDYALAATLYRQLVEAGQDSGPLHYNLGNAYLRNGELGRAIAAYLRSSARLPRNEDVRANLEFARRSARDALEPPAPPAVVSTLFFWHFLLSRAELAWLVAGLNLLFWSCLALRLWRPSLPAAGGLAATLLVLLVAAGGSLAVHTLQPRRVAVIVPQELAARTAPETDSVTRFKLHAGSEVRVRGSRDGWLRISLPSGEQGWIESQWAELVEI